MMNRKRLKALLLLLGMVIVLAVSSAYMLHEAGHHCTGEDCPICQMIARQVQLLRAIGLALVFLGILPLSGRKSFFRPLQGRALLPARGTLVGWKIRMDD